MSPRPTQPSPGDYSGRQKATANKEQVQAQQERSKEMSMAGAAQTQEELHGVHDPKTGEVIGGPAPHTATVLTPPEEGSEFGPEAPQMGGIARDVARVGGFPGLPQEPVLSGKEPPEAEPPALPVRPFTQPPVQVLRSAYVTVRVNQDVEDMTYGMTPSGEPDNYTFKEGYQYRVKSDLAEHLNERGLVGQWIG